MKLRLKRLLAVIVLVTLCITMVPVQSYASQATKDKVNQAEKEKNEAEKNVQNAKGEVKDLTSKRKKLEKELNNLNDEYLRITERLADLENKITVKEGEIKYTEETLEKAKTTEANQYASMKKRIQFMYEDSESLVLEIIFKAKSFSDFLTLYNYVNGLAAYDRKQFNSYQETRKNIENLEASLKTEKEELDGLKAEAEQEKANVEKVMADTEDKVTEYNNLIDDAEAVLLQKEKELKEAESNLEVLKKKLEEEIRLSQLALQSAWRNISEVQFDANDRYRLAIIIYCEAGGEPYEGQLAVGAVVINRVLSSVYPSTVEGVLRQKYQFSPVLSGRYDKYYEIGKTTPSCYRAADEAMSGLTNIGNCTHFRTPIPGLEGIRIGNHIFY